jgi:hypothetical protein
MSTPKNREELIGFIATTVKEIKGDGIGRWSIEWAELLIKRLEAAGLAAVPVDPTEEMVKATADRCRGAERHQASARKSYQQMLAASPFRREDQ